MFRLFLPANVLLFLVSFATAEELDLPGLSPGAEKLDLPECSLTGDANNCVRFLACVGTEGLWMDGQARGWNEGTLIGQRNDGVACAGSWTAGNGPMGSGTAGYECTDGSKGQVIYFAQDSLTGTVIARGMDDMGRHLKAWSGENVLKFLGDGDVDAAKLPCSDTPILLSRATYAED